MTAGTCCGLWLWYIYFTACISQALELRGGGPIDVEGIFQNSFPAFTFTSNQTGTHGLDYRPIGAYGSLCRIVDPNTTCPPFEIENGFLDIDFAVSLFHPSVLYGNGALGQSEWVDDVIAFPVGTFAFMPVFNLGKAIYDTNQDVVLDVSVLGDIFAANITNWRDPRIIESLEKAGSGEIAKLMPDANITIVINAFDWTLEFLMIEVLSQYSQAMAEAGGFQILTPWYWVPNKILHFNRDDVIGTLLSTDFTIAVMPSMVVTRFELPVIKLRHGEGPIVPPEPENINAAVLERGISFGVDSFQVPTIESPGVGTRSVHSWPLINYIFIAIRSNSKGDRLRPGATCEHIRQTINYFEWLTAVDDGRAYLTGLGTAALPIDMSESVIQFVKGNTQCVDGLAFPVATPPAALVDLKATTIMCEWATARFLLLDSRAVEGAPPLWGEIAQCSDDYVETQGFPPGITAMFLPQLEKSSLPKGSSQVPFFFYEYAVMANLWSIGDIDKEFIITVNIIRDIYRGKITKWNDSRLTALNQGLQSTNATIRVIKICGLEDHSTALREMLEVDYCNITLPGEQLVLDYAEMEGVLLMTPFSFGAIPNFQADLEFETDLNIAAFITSPSQPPSTFNSSNQITSAETGGNATIVSILKSDDRLRALEACLDENSLVNGTILINHSSSDLCYPLTHVIDLVLVSSFAEETCQQSRVPMTIFNLAVYSANNLREVINASLEGVYVPYSSPEFGQALLQTTESTLRASMKCGDEPLVTLDLFEDSSARITQDSAIFITCATCVALMSALMVLTAIALSAKLDDPQIRSAGGITLVVFIGFLFFKMAVTVLLMYDDEQLEGICLVRPIAFLIGVTGSSAVLFFRMLRVYKIFSAKGVLRIAYNSKWVISHVIAVVSLVAVITVPIYIILGGGKSSRHTISEDTEELTKFFMSYQSTSVEYFSLCDSEEMILLATLGVHAIFLPANLFLGVPLWSVDEKYSDARLIVFTSVLAIVFSAPNWTLYFFWRKSAYNNAVTLVAFANLSECILMFFMFAISKLFGTISNRIAAKRATGSDTETPRWALQSLNDQVSANSVRLREPKGTCDTNIATPVTPR